MKSSEVLEKLDLMIDNPHCELLYNKDYELLIALVLASQSLDKRVNEVTKVLFTKYDIHSLASADINDIIKIIYPVGTYNKKSIYIKEICNRLIKDYNGIVPNDRDYIESLPGIGRKSCNVFLAEIYNVPTIAVDTHVKRVSNILGLSKNSDVLKIEHDLESIFPKKEWIKLHHELVLFGRYICKSKKPLCNKCLFKDRCRHKT